jgi:hypothetical protein
MVMSIAKDLVTQYYELRTKRLALQQEVNALEQKEKDIAYELTKGLDDGLENYYLTLGDFSFKADKKIGAFVTDWPATLKYVKDTGELDLLQKRLTISAVKQRWDNGVFIPGVEKSFNWALTVTKE